MLFLHALLFFLLGTSALATPVPITPGDSSNPSKLSRLVVKVKGAFGGAKPERLNGYWRSNTVKFSWGPEPSEIIIRISNAKDVEVLFPTLPEDQRTVKVHFRNIFDKQVTWHRIRPDEKITQVMRAPPDIEPDWMNDKLVIEYWDSEATLDILLNGSGVRYDTKVKGFMPLFSTRQQVSGYWRSSISRKKGGPKDMVYIFPDLRVEINFPRGDVSDKIYPEIFDGLDAWTRVTSDAEYQASLDTKETPAHETRVDEKYLKDVLRITFKQGWKELHLRHTMSDQTTETGLVPLNRITIANPP